MHQGISLDSLQQAFGLLGEEVWKTTFASARDDDPDELHAAVQAAGQVMRHVTLVSTAVAQAYLDEAEGVWRDREVSSAATSSRPWSAGAATPTPPAAAPARWA